MMMRALRGVTYAGRHYNAGDLFELVGRGPQADRRVLIAAQLAEDVADGNDSPTTKTRSYKRRDLQAEDE